MWLSKEYALVTAKDRLIYARKFHGCLFRGNLSDLLLLTEDQRQHAVKALSTLSKFLGVHEDFKRAMKNYGLKWASKRTDNLIVKRLTEVYDPNDIFNWILKVKNAAPDLSNFINLMAVTGVRYNEAVESYNLLVGLKAEGRVNEYFNMEKQILEHYRFKDIFIRNSKKLFISFVPQRVIQDIGPIAEPVDWARVKKRVAWRVKRLRFGDIREYWASIMTRHLSQPEIDFLQGRVSTSVFMRNYFNPAWITDLKARAIKGAEEILGKI